jgi:diadenosine tetraphosphate (Ap4A) HIT family hydrolase
MSGRFLDIDDRKEPRPPAQDISNKNCTICSALSGETVHYKLAETVYWYALLDNEPLSDGHVILTTKTHYQNLEDIPRAQMQELGPLISIMSQVYRGENWNLLVNNGRLAHQFTDHACVHFIPKPSSKEGLLIRWLIEPKSQDELLKSATAVTDHLGNVS